MKDNNHKNEAAASDILGPDTNQAGAFTRREFVAGTMVAGTAFSLASMTGCSFDSSQPLGVVKPPLARPMNTPPGIDRAHENRYRNKWRWDKVVKGTHNTNCGQQTGCNFNIYVRDGKVIREEQASIYPQTNDDVSDFNPRGCQKGCSYSEMMYSDARLTKPLKRAGERGEGKWEEISWDQLTTEVADKLIDILVEHGPSTIVSDTGTDVMGQTPFVSMLRFSDAIDGVVLDLNAEIGDDIQGCSVTMGDNGGGRSGDDYFNSDLILIWGGNPAYTQIPDYHFFTEARYNGARIVSIAPDYNASAMHADQWIPVKPGSDAALAMAVCQVAISENKHHVGLLKEQTNLTFLVRTDTQKLLRESDLKKKGSPEALYRWDLKTNALEMPGAKTLALSGKDPALEGEFEVETLQGKVTVKPAFEFLKEELKNYTPEKASKLCGVAPDLIRQFAHMMIDAKACSNVMTFSFGKFYHGDLMMRSQILAFLVTGHLGQKGAGYAACGLPLPDGGGDLLMDLFAGQEMRWDIVKRYGPGLVKDFMTGQDMKRSMNRLQERLYADEKLLVSSTLFWNVHGGLIEVSGQKWDKDLKRDVKDYLDEAMDKGWLKLDPMGEKKPKAMISWAGNMIRRVRSSKTMRENLWPNLDLVMVFDLRLSSTAMWADYVLPAAASYEKPNVLVLNTMTHNPFALASNKAVEPVGNTKDEWEIICLLAKKMGERAKERGIDHFISKRGKKRKFADLYPRITRNGELGEKDVEKLSEILVENSSNLGGISWEQFKEQGMVKYSEPGNHPFSHGQSSDFIPHETTTPYTHHTEKKMPWPTLSGRLEFYIDHDWYLEAGEQLPVFKNPPMAGGDYPLVMTGGHCRWSIHSLQRTDPLMLRLQRGEPSTWISVEDAESRGIKEGDLIEIYNDAGHYQSLAKISASIQPGQIVTYHAWENYQFEGETSYRDVQVSPLKPIEMVGNAPYMSPVIAMRHPGMNDRDTRVEIKTVKSWS